MCLGKLQYFTNLNCWAIKGDDFPKVNHDSRVRENSVVVIIYPEGKMTIWTIFLQPGGWSFAPIFGDDFLEKSRNVKASLMATSRKNPRFIARSIPRYIYIYVYLFIYLFYLFILFIYFIYFIYLFYLFMYLFIYLYIYSVVSLCTWSAPSFL